MIVRDVTPAQLGLTGAAQLVLILRSANAQGKTMMTRSYFVTSRPAARLEPLGILNLRRRQWGIESICHQRLDVSLPEDKSRVRSVSGVAELGLLSRISLRTPDSMPGIFADLETSWHHHGRNCCQLQQVTCRDRR